MTHWLIHAGKPNPANWEFQMSEPSLISINLKTTASDQVHTIEVPENLEVTALKQLASDYTNIPADEMRLIFCGKALKNGTTLDTYNVKDGTTIHVFPGRKPRPESETSSEQPQPEPMAPMDTPTVDVHIEQIDFTEINEGHSIQRAIDKLYAISSKLNLAIAELQEAALSENQELINTKIREFQTASASASTRLMVLSQSLNEFRTGNATNGNNPRMQFMNMPGNLQGIIGGIMPGVMGNLGDMLSNILGGQQNRQNQPPNPAPAPAPSPQTQQQNQSNGGSSHDSDDEPPSYIC